MISRIDTLIILFTAILVYACLSIDIETPPSHEFLWGSLQNTDMPQINLTGGLAKNSQLSRQEKPHLLGDDTWSRNKLEEGVELLQRHEKIDGNRRAISIIGLDIEERGDDFRLAAIHQLEDVDDAHRLTISEFGEEFDALAATNAGFAHGGTDYYNSGILKIDGEVFPYYDNEPEELSFVGSSAFGIDDDNNWHFTERDGLNWDAARSCVFLRVGLHTLSPGY